MIEIICVNDFGDEPTEYVYMECHESEAGEYCMALNRYARGDHYDILSQPVYFYQRKKADHESM